MSAVPPSPPFEDETLLEFILAQFRSATATNTLVRVSSTFCRDAFILALIDRTAPDCFEYFFDDNKLFSAKMRGNVLDIQQEQDVLASGYFNATDVLIYKTPLSEHFTERMSPLMRSKGIHLYVAGDNGHIVNAFPASKSAAKH